MLVVVVVCWLLCCVCLLRWLLCVGCCVVCWFVVVLLFLLFLLFLFVLCCCYCSGCSDTRANRPPSYAFRGAVPCFRVFLCAFVVLGCSFIPLRANGGGRGRKKFHRLPLDFRSEKAFAKSPAKGKRQTEEKLGVCIGSAALLFPL